jgi:hypothetical protein
MTAPAPIAAPPRKRTRLIVWLAVTAGLLVVAGANWHLVHVAMTSQPDCIEHLRPGHGDAERGLFSAAQSSCSPKPRR